MVFRFYQTRPNTIIQHQTRWPNGKWMVTKQCLMLFKRPNISSLARLLHQNERSKRYRIYTKYSFFWIILALPAEQLKTRVQSTKSNRDLKIYDGEVNENVTSKYNFCIVVSLLRLFHAVRVVRYGRSILKITGTRGFKVKIENETFTYCNWARVVVKTSNFHQWWFNVVVKKSTAKIYLKVRAARAKEHDYLYSFIQWYCVLALTPGDCVVDLEVPLCSHEPFRFIK